MGGLRPTPCVKLVVPVNRESLLYRSRIKKLPWREPVTRRSDVGISVDWLPTEKVISSGFWTRVQFPSSPPKNTAEKDTFSAVFFYPSRRLGISSPHEVWWISSALWAVYHHAMACILCGLMIYNAPHWWYTATSCLMIYTFCESD